MEIANIKSTSLAHKSRPEFPIVWMKIEEKMKKAKKKQTRISSKRQMLLHAFSCTLDEFAVAGLLLFSNATTNKCMNNNNKNDVKKLQFASQIV